MGEDTNVGTPGVVRRAVVWWLAFRAGTVCHCGQAVVSLCLMVGGPFVSGLHNLVLVRLRNAQAHAHSHAQGHQDAHALHG